MSDPAQPVVPGLPDPTAAVGSRATRATGDGALAWLLRAGLAALLPAAWALQAAAGRQPARVEAEFSRGVFASVAGALSCVSDRFPFPVAEALLLGLVALVPVRLAVLARRRRGLRRRGLRSMLALAADGVALAGAGAVVFLGVWGLNYQRVPFATSAGYDVRPGDAAELELLSVELIEAANAERDRLSEDSAGVVRLPDGLAGVLARAPEGFQAAARRYPFLAGGCGRPKSAWLSPVLSRLGIAGIYVPFTAEPLVNGEMPAPDLPFNAAHEMAHRRGFAREDEANYIGYLACRLHPDGEFRYSGQFVASSYALGALGKVDGEAWARVAPRRSAAVQRDAEAVRAWVQAHVSRASEVSRRVNDAYLRSQGEARGTRSYGRMVDLLLAERRARLAGR